MARTREGAALTEAHRLAQVALQKRTVADFLTIWRLLDSKDLARSFPGYFRAATIIINANREKSTGLATAYLDAFRRAEGSGPLTIARAGAVADEVALKSLTVTGPVEVKKAIATGKPVEDAMRRGLVASVGAASRHVADAGRETIYGTARESSLRVARVTDGSPCAFCAMLAGRGAVYTEETGDFQSHDACGCTTEPAIGDDYSPPARSQDFADLYESATREAEPGTPLLLAFRRAYDARRTP